MCVCVCVGVCGCVCVRAWDFSGSAIEHSFQMCLDINCFDDLLIF